MGETSVYICPRCQTQVIRMPHSGDYVHKCQGEEVLANEDVLIIGDWSDYTNIGSMGPSELVVNLESTRTSAGALVNGNTVDAQEFRLNTAEHMRLDKVSAIIYRDPSMGAGLTQEYIFMSIRNNLSGADLAIGSMRIGSINTTSTLKNLSWHEFDMDKIELSPNTPYYLVGRFPSGADAGPTGSRVLWMFPSVVAGDPYPYGQRWITTDGDETTWSPTAGSDMFIRVYANPYNVTRQPNALKQGTENKLFGTRADIEGDKETPRRTSRGFPQNRFRTRQHYEYLDENFFKSSTSKAPRDPEEYP